MEVNVSELKVNDKVLVVYGDDFVDYVGFVSSITDKHLVLHEYVPDIYRTLCIDNIVELSKR
ncbi:hypothetical protein [Sporosarcina highlanderae]|uniref:DUF2187 domain-containing protein n=1 Tax=Sporosarcina highlanderae TaxID=3035916 RepID=A0ABT8JXN1_9BACL|nr:hypothetical protein [Sporosarcina highlanderae]MDN4609107.1 hypothetical protein [Sporosarcina highlanderae]